MSKFFIRRPIVAIVIAIVMIIGGVISMETLPVAQYPDIAPPSIVLSASYPGADADTVTQSVATPIEQQISGVNHMDYMYSINSNNGSTSLTGQFALGTNPDTDQILMQMRYDQASGQLAAPVTAGGVTVQPSAAMPMMLVAITSPNGTYDANYLANYAYINLVDPVGRAKGVGRVQVFGAAQYAMRVWVNPDTLAKLGVTVTDITSAISTQNTVNPAGKIGAEPIRNGEQYTYSVRTDGRLTTESEFGEIVVRANPNGQIVRLKDVARIELGTQNYDMIGRMNGKPAAFLAVFQLPGSNALQTADNVRAAVSTLSKSFPQDLVYSIPLDTTKVVTAGIREIVETLFIALGLVIIVVFLFLQGWRATLIPLLAIPVSLIGTFIVFPFLGFSINTLSLFGMVLAIGLVVDDAIVVVEAVEHHIEKGLSPKDASIKAMEEVSSPVIAIALILAAVFIPTAFISGIKGQLYQQFAITIAISVIFSAFNALTLSPALCALLLKPKKKSTGLLARFFDWFDRVFGKSTDNYVNTSAFLIRKFGIALIFLVAAGGAAALIGIRVPSSFLPEEDQGYLMVSLQLPDASSFSRTTEAVAQVEDVLSHTPGVANVISAVGLNLMTGTETTYNSFFFVPLKDWDERKSKEEQYENIKQAVAQGLFGKVRNGVAFSFPPPVIPGVGTSGGVTFVLEDRSGGQDNDFLTQNADKFVAALQKRPEIAMAINTALPHVPQLSIHVDRAKAMAQGVNLANVYGTIQTFMGGSLVNYFNRFGRQWQTYVEADSDSRASIDNIGRFYVPTASATTTTSTSITSSSGGLVPLSAITTIKQITGPEFIMRFNEYSAVQLSISANPGYSSGQVMNALEEVFRQTMPAGMGYDYKDMSYEEKQAATGTSALTTYALSLTFVFLILAAQYESWTLPFSVLLGTPIALLGAFLALWSRSLENSTYAQIGVVMIIGLAAKNAILIVEYAKSNLDAGTPLVEAALGAARLRLRPILMTAFAFILGCVPLWIASGPGAQGRRTLGTVCIGGMLMASIIEIAVIPVLFVLVERISHAFTRKTPDEGTPPTLVQKSEGGAE
jgi:hydrophobic/amphiphilic exporter-1 (mainly G- bacteria), HAE1 family